MELPALVIVPVSPDGTKVMTIGLLDEPKAPAATVGGLGNGEQLAGGTVAVGAAAVGTVVLVGTTGPVVGGTDVLVGAVVAAGVQAASAIVTITNNRANRYMLVLRIIFSSSLNKLNIWGTLCTFII